MKMKVICYSDISVCRSGRALRRGGVVDGITFMPYCSFATMGLWLMNSNSLRFQSKGSGTMRAMKTDISNMRSPKTWRWWSALG